MSQSNTAIQEIEKRISRELEALRSDIVDIGNINDLEALRAKYLGRKSYLAITQKGIGTLSAELKPFVGKNTNIARKEIEKLLGSKEKELKVLEYDQQMRKNKLDLTLPGRKTGSGSKNIISQIVEEIEEIFIGMGFEIAEGPEIETDYYNFEALNTPKDHPARSLHDTMFISDNVLLRTQTSPVQIRYMEKNKPPIAIIVPGRVYRKDYDVSHTPMFTQVEGLVIDKGINFGNLKWTLETFVREIFGSDREVRFRPHYFPFTEPSAEVDVSCNICSGSGCRVCSGTGWLEILGSGMVDPKLYDFVDYDPDEVSGFAFGVGVERICMLKYGIDDLRLFFENDLRFVRQF
ncbi:MAG TPA: phenylalanine--tRNA ligase subunit alpha [Actinobacteria bacterium]|nr:phenylalanine--tRNA ligase subunit alpha [Actinomycetota bacterium]